MENRVTHTARIVKIEGHDVTLAIHDEAPEACGACRLADLCARADNEGHITVTVNDVAGFAAGMMVTAAVDRRSQGIAIVWSLVMPLLLFVGALMPLSASPLPRWAVLVAAIAIVALYNLALWLFGPRISRSVKWTLELVP